MVNRSALIVIPKQPYIDWALSLDDSGVAPDLDDEHTVYLIPDYDTDADQEKILRNLYSQIFEEELYGWHNEESKWPQNRSYSMFLKWFEVRFHSVVEDLGSGRIYDQDA